MNLLLLVASELKIDESTASASRQPTLPLLDVKQAHETFGSLVWINIKLGFEHQSTGFHNSILFPYYYYYLSSSCKLFWIRFQKFFCFYPRFLFLDFIFTCTLVPEIMKLAFWFEHSTYKNFDFFVKNKIKSIIY